MSSQLPRYLNEEVVKAAGFGAKLVYKCSRCSVLGIGDSILAHFCGNCLRRSASLWRGENVVPLLEGIKISRDGERLAQGNGLIAKENNES